ncbi:MAG: hypothetical protein SFU86_22265 [Pirellulaceae bacterium]|nr:hypothetical protein [Pirellulaceae bacterium]
MSFRLRSTTRWLGSALVAGALLLGNSALAATPPWPEVRQIVVEHVAKLPSHEPGDLLTAEDLRPALARLAQRGFDVAAKELGASPLLSESHPLLKLLRTPAGIRLTRELREQPEIYDRLERLVHFAAGRELIHQLVESHNVAGILALGGPDAAARLEANFPQEPTCRNLTVRSGRTFTLEQYLVHLRTMHRLAELNLSRPGE